MEAASNTGEEEMEAVPTCRFRDYGTKIPTTDVRTKLQAQVLDLPESEGSKFIENNMKDRLKAAVRTLLNGHLWTNLCVPLSSCSPGSRQRGCLLNKEGRTARIVGN